MIKGMVLTYGLLEALGVLDKLAVNPVLSRCYLWVAVGGPLIPYHILTPLRKCRVHLPYLGSGRTWCITWPPFYGSFVAYGAPVKAVNRAWAADPGLQPVASCFSARYTSSSDSRWHSITQQPTAVIACRCESCHLHGSVSKTWSPNTNPNILWHLL